MAFVARFLTLVALLLAPLGMMRAHAAVANGGHATSHARAMTGDGGHCAGRDQPAPQPDKASIDCTIRNLTTLGASLNVASPVGIPDKFVLIVRSDDTTRQCIVVWRKEKQIGVAFC